MIDGTNFAEQTKFWKILLSRIIENFYCELFNGVNWAEMYNTLVMFRLSFIYSFTIIIVIIETRKSFKGVFLKEIWEI